MSIVRTKCVPALVAALPAALLVLACGRAPKADPRDAEQVASGQRVYTLHCASCHGANLEGELDWKTRKPSGRLPAPPHDESGHTWHHSDAALFGLVKQGMKPPYASAGYQSDMPGFAETLSDQQIWDVLAYIKSRWPERIQKAQAQMGK